MQTFLELTLAHEKRKTAFKIFETAYRQYIKAREESSAFYDRIPRDISAAFFDNPAVESLNRALEAVLKAAALEVSAQLAEVLHYMTEEPLVMSVKASAESPAIEVKGVEGFLKYIEATYVDEVAYGA